MNFGWMLMLMLGGAIVMVIVQEILKSRNNDSREKSEKKPAWTRNASEKDMFGKIKDWAIVCVLVLIAILVLILC